MKDAQTVLTSPVVVTFLITAYVLLLLILLGAELGVPWLAFLRATNQVLVLLALLFLPFLLLALGQAIRSVSVKLSGQELHFEMRELRDDVQVQVKQAETRFAAQVSVSEQALWPMLAGNDPTSIQRWRDKVIVVGSKLDGSQAFLAHFLAAWLEKRLPGLKCVMRVPNGGSLKNFADLKYHWIDVYVDYTGTCCQYFNIDHRGKTPDQLVAALNGFGAGLGVRWLSLLGATEDYCLVIRRSICETEGVRTIQELARIAPTLVFTADPEFINRRDCFVGLKQRYDLDFKRVEPCRATDRYALLKGEQADVFVGYQSDPELASPSLMILQDTDGFFPGYHALPVTSSAVLQHIAGLEEALDELKGSLRTDDLVEMVRKLRHRGSRGAVVRELAEQFLLEHPPAT